MVIVYRGTWAGEAETTSIIKRRRVFTPRTIRSAAGRRDPFGFEPAAVARQFFDPVAADHH
jgi:hypothetical protein